MPHALPISLRSTTRCLTALAVAVVAACSGGSNAISYDSDGVARGVLDLVPRNTAWARSLEPDAVLYKIELRPEAPGAAVPSSVLYHFYAPEADAFMTATSDPKVPWEGAEPQNWPPDQIQPMPLPAVVMDFREAWDKARVAGLTNVTSVTLDVQRRFGVVLVVWSLLGKVPQPAEDGVYFNALSGERVMRATLINPPASPLMVDKAMFEYRRALRGKGTAKNPCPEAGIPIPVREPVICFNVDTRDYSEPEA